MRRVAVLAAAGLLILAIPARAAGPKIAAHRGGAALRPENSLLAFRNAIALGADALEFDLHLTRDDVVVVIHDPTLDRTTTASGPVRDRTLAELRSARLTSRDGRVTDERVPTLTELLDLARAGSIELLPEIKVGVDGQPYPGMEEKVLDLIRTHDMLARVTIQAFHPATIRRLLALQPGIRTMYLASRRQLEAERASGADAVRRARDAGATDLGIEFRVIDATVVAAARAAKIRLSAWTVNEEPDIRRMLDLGVDVIMSDRPDLALKVGGVRDAPPKPPMQRRGSE
jgi:glycerophosphoryl diester phosphodiesterase